LEQPAAKSRFDWMYRVAGGSNAGLQQQHFIVPDAKVPHGDTAVDGLAELASGDAGRGHG
jgi:hypothetical protein